jgi:hypothetical protein
VSCTVLLICGQLASSIYLKWDNLYVRKVAQPCEKVVRLVALPTQKEQTKNYRPIKDREKKKEKGGAQKEEN